MLVKKKYVIQKSFRIDRRLEYDIALLAELTNRSQNDLVNAAIEEFLKDNKEWFVQNVIVEQYAPIFECTEGDYDSIFKMGGVEAELKEEDGFYKVHYTETENGEPFEYEKNISISDEDAKEQLKECLRYIASFINTEDEEVKQYIKQRLNYDDFFATKKKV